MEIKIKKNYDKEGQHSFKTNLIEGDKITHERVYFKSKEDFINKYNEKSKGIDGCVVGVPEGFWFSNKPLDIEEGCFIFIQYRLNDSKIEFIVVMDRVVYITNKGQTIDIIDPAKRYYFNSLLLKIN